MLKIPEILNMIKNEFKSSVMLKINKIKEDTKRFRFFGKALYFSGAIKEIRLSPYNVIKLRKFHPFIILITIIAFLIDHELFLELKEMSV